MIPILPDTIAAYRVIAEKTRVRIAADVHAGIIGVRVHGDTVEGWQGIATKRGKITKWLRLTTGGYVLLEHLEAVDP